MPTTHPRVNVVLEKPLYQSLLKIAKREGISLSLKARDLIREALKNREKIYWANIAAIPDSVQLTVRQKNELEKRLKAYHLDPQKGASWEEVKKRIRKHA